MRLSLITIMIGALAITANLFNFVGHLGVFGGLWIMFMWFWPSILVWYHRELFRGINQRYLIGLQIFRVIGGVFLIECYRGHIPVSFALPAGVGDLIVGFFALYFVVRYQNIPRFGVYTVLGLGIVDFASAFFFGFTSSDGPAQLFAFGFNNQLNLFPTGMIPQFLVPYAILYHTLSWINLRVKK
jgi:hypothetical protein